MRPNLTLPVLLLSVSITVAFSGCTAITSRRVTAFETISIPELGVTTTKSVGEALIELARGNVERTITIPTTYTIGEYTIPAGMYSYDTDTKTDVWFRNKDYSVYFFTRKSDDFLCGASTACAKLDYKIGKVLVSTEMYAFQQTLLYNGKNGNRITLAYREFANGMARPAFSNTVDYDISESRIVSYKGARIEIINATSSDLTYRVISGFQ